jgi:hypothetical protein
MADIELQRFRVLDKIRVWQAGRETEVRSMGLGRLRHI